MTQEEYEFFQRQITESNFAKHLGFEVVEQTRGRVILRLPYKDEFLQALGRFHGGVIFSLADHASGWASVSTLERGDRCATLEMKINYIAPVVDENILAEATVIHAGRTSIVVESDVKTEAGRLVAKTLATFVILKSQSNADVRE